MSQINRSTLVQLLTEYTQDEARLQQIYSTIQEASTQIQKALIGQHGSFADIERVHTQHSWQAFIQKISSLITEAEFISMRDELALQTKPEPISMISLQNLLRVAGVEITDEPLSA